MNFANFQQEEATEQSVSRCPNLRRDDISNKFGRESGEIRAAAQFVHELSRGESYSFRAARYRSASMAAAQPMPAAVTACR